MSDPSIHVEGACRCGATRFEVTAEPMLTMACHCTGCQAMTSSAYSLSAAIPVAGFRVIAGRPVAGGLKRPPVHQFCPECLTWMFTRADGFDFVNVRPTLLEGARWAFPFIETYVSEKLPWAVTPAIHSFDTFPPMERWPELMAAYATR